MISPQVEIPEGARVELRSANLVSRVLLSRVLPGTRGTVRARLSWPWRMVEWDDGSTTNLMPDDLDLVRVLHPLELLAEVAADGPP